MQVFPYNNVFVIIQHPKITVRIQDEVLALRTYYNSYLGTNKARSASARPATRDAQHRESEVLNNYIFVFSIKSISIITDSAYPMTHVVFLTCLLSYDIINRMLTRL